MSSTQHLATAIAYALLAGPWVEAEMVARVREALDPRTRIATGVAKLALRLYPEAPLGRERELAKRLARTKVIAGASSRGARVERWFVPALSMAEPAFPGLDVPPLLNSDDVAGLTGLDAEALAWFADMKRFNRRARPEQLRHYHYRWLKKRSGAYRLIEAPKPRLKLAQRRILDEILQKVPLHDACHGHRAARSVKSFAIEHTGRAQLLTLDLCEFFNVISEARVRAIFEALGYNDVVAPLLAALCCAPTPEHVLRSRPRALHGIDEVFRQRMVLRGSHLPQGAPTSPALANLAAFRLDVRLSALARRFDARYGRYADDLAFSGDRRLAAVTSDFVAWVGAIALEEGFAVRHRKTRVMPGAQRQTLCGLVVNERVSLKRAALQELEATLFNSVRSGPHTQNRAGVADFRAHLHGRVSWAAHVNPQRGDRLRALLAQIQW